MADQRSRHRHLRGPPGRLRLGQAAILAALFTLTALPNCFPWLASGAALQRYLRTPRARRILNTTMAALLAASTVLVIWTRL